MHISKVASIINSIAKGLEPTCVQCLTDNSGVVLQVVKEQIYSGQTGAGELISPTYDDDPYFNEPGHWYGLSQMYKAWKREITPPVQGTLIGLPPRPDNVPNLFINGKFFSEITATRKGDVLVTNPGSGDGPDIVAKYGDQLLNMGPNAIQYFNNSYMLPAINNLFKDSGYR